MNTFTFFNDNFGKYLSKQTNRPHIAAGVALSSYHPMFNKKGKKAVGRLVSGWAIIRSTGSVMSQTLDIQGISYDDRTRFEAFYDELASWDGTPRIFLTFDKAPIPIANIFMTLDLRAVRICSPKGAETFDYTKPALQNAGDVRRGIERFIGNKAKQDAA